MKKMLSMNGGGIRGIIEAAMVKYVEGVTGKQAYQLFDYIAGTSAGGINALALGAGITGNDLVNFYSSKGSEIFSRSFWRKVISLGSYAGSKYDGTGLTTAVTSVFGDTTLKQSKTKVMIPTYEIQQRQTVFFKSWYDYDFKMVDVARATASAPTFFPPVQTKSVDGLYTLNCVDGGMSCNQPSLCVLVESIRVDGVEPKDCLILSLNTGNDETPIDYNKAKGWGELSWISPVIGIALDSGQDLVDYQLNKLMPAGQYLNLNTAKGAITGSIANLDNTNASNINALLALSNKIIADNKPQLDAFIEQLVKV